MDGTTRYIDLHFTFTFTFTFCFDGFMKKDNLVKIILNLFVYSGKKCYFCSCYGK